MSDDLLILSDVVSSCISFVSVTGFFLTTASSLTYGVFFTSPISSFLTGMFMSCVEETGVSACVSPLGGLVSTVTSSWVSGT